MGTDKWVITNGKWTFEVPIDDFKRWRDDTFDFGYKTQIFMKGILERIDRLVESEEYQAAQALIPEGKKLLDKLTPLITQIDLAMAQPDSGEPGRLKDRIKIGVEVHSKVTQAKEAIKTIDDSDPFKAEAVRAFTTLVAKLTLLFGLDPKP